MTRKLQSQPSDDVAPSNGRHDDTRSSDASWQLNVADAGAGEEGRHDAAGYAERGERFGAAPCCSCQRFIGAQPGRAASAAAGAE